MVGLGLGGNIEIRLHPLCHLNLHEEEETKSRKDKKKQKTKEQAKTNEEKAIK